MIQKVDFPKSSVLSLKDFDYFDTYQASFFDENNKYSVSYIGKVFFSTTSGWINQLFHLRNKIVSLFGLKVPENIKERERLLEEFECEPGQKLGLFQVYEKNDNEVILGEDDRHLNFKVSFLKENLFNHKKQLSVTTVVKFNNRFGKYYFFIIKPFHKLIVKSMLKKLIKNLN